MNIKYWKSMEILTGKKSEVSEQNVTEDRAVFKRISKN